MFQNQIERTLEELKGWDGRGHHMLTSASGWARGYTTWKGEQAQAYMVGMSWNSMDMMDDVKKDENSLYNNTFVALKDLPSLGTETALYMCMGLKEKRTGRARHCVVS